MKILLRMQAKDVTSAIAITEALGENDEWHKRWADDIFLQIWEFDLGLATSKASGKQKASTIHQTDNFVNHTASDFSMQASGSRTTINKRQRTR